MKRFISFLALGAFVAALAAPLALAQGGSTEPAKAAPAATAPAKPAEHKTASKPAAKPAVEKVDLNSATREDLAKLPGVGDAIADRIIAGRPYKARTDLLKNKIVTAKEYARVKALVVARQAAPSTTR
ncbi:MAG: helix-hairpin-helix domain-containing protein [Candidatus Eisenbacteria bacterium]|nr:helix-hairpin-helix domain-containing protein [Candidatus Eisenbacteria bacterium]